MTKLFTLEEVIKEIKKADKAYRRKGFYTNLYLTDFIIEHLTTLHIKENVCSKNCNWKDIEHTHTPMKKWLRATLHKKGEK